MTRRRTTTLKTATATEAEHDFVLVLTGIKVLNRQVEDALFEAGCDDATISLRFGAIYLTFSRVAPTLKEAILSAVRDVRRAQIGADVLRVDDCNLVTQAEIARRIGRSRQLVNQYITSQRGPGAFPPPVGHITEGNPLWLWCDVAYWLRRHNMIKEDVFTKAQLVDTINRILDFHHQLTLAPALTHELLGHLTASPALA
jgi:hypothetical protein